MDEGEISPFATLLIFVPLLCVMIYFLVRYMCKIFRTKQLRIQREFEDQAHLRLDAHVLDSADLLETAYLEKGVNGIKVAALYNLINAKYVQILEHSVEGKEGVYRTLKVTPGSIDLLEMAGTESALHPVELILLKAHGNYEIRFKELVHLGDDPYVTPIDPLIRKFTDEYHKKYIEAGFIYSDEMRIVLREKMQPLSNLARWCLYGILVFLLFCGVLFYFFGPLFSSLSPLEMKVYYVLFFSSPASFHS